MFKRGVSFALISLIVFLSSFSGVNFNVKAADSISYKMEDSINPEILISNFEAGTDSWTKSTNVSSVTTVTTTANSPGTPYNGSYLFELTSSSVAGTSWRTVYRSFSTPIDASKTPYFQAAVNSWGIASNSFEVMVKFYSGTNSIYTTIPITSDKWDLISVNLSNWSYKSSITKIEISWRSTTFSSNWTSKQQLDFVGFGTGDDWDFNTSGDFEGWTANSNYSNTSVSSGALNATIIGNDPAVTKTGIYADSGYSKYINLKLKNNSANTTAKIYWITSLDQSWSDSKTKTFNITANDASYKTYSIDFNNISNWSGFITGIRLDIPENPSSISGTINIDAVEISTMPAGTYYKWNFDKDSSYNGWQTVQQISSSNVSGGYFNYTINGTDPYIYYTYQLNAAASMVKYLTVRMRNKTNGTEGKIYWTTNADTSWSESKTAAFTINANDSEFGTFSLDLSSNTYWNNTIRQIRIDIPNNATVGSGTVSINYIKLASEPDNVYYGGSVTSVSADATTITVSGTGASGKSLSLVELQPYEQFNFSAAYNVLATTTSNGAFTFNISRFNGSTDRLYSKFAVVVNDTVVKLLDSPKYVTANSSSVNTYAFPQAASIKGLQVQMIDDAQKLGLSHAAFNLQVEQCLISPQYATTENSIQYTMDGEVFYFRKGYFEGLDKQVKGFSDAGGIVTLLFNNYPAIPSDGVAEIRHPDYVSGTVAAINTANAMGTKYWKAIAEFAVERYTRADQLYKAKFTPGVDAFILHRHVDNRDEGGLNLGIWTRRDGSSGNPGVPYQQKYIYNVMKKIDSSESLSVTDFAKTIIGITDWSQVIPNFNSNVLADRPLVSQGTLSVLPQIAPTSYVVGFESGGTGGFYASEQSTSAASVTSMLNSPGVAYNGSRLMEVPFLFDEILLGASGEAGATKVYATPLDITSTPKLQFALNSYGGCTGATAYYATVRVYSGLNCIEGTVQVNPNSWNPLSMDLSNWQYKNSVDKVKIWFHANSQESWGGNFQIDYFGYAS